MKQRILPFIIGLSALSVSASAAFYSVFGLSKLFAGASFQVMVMAASLEFAKLVVASLLYQYWSTINKLLRFYLCAAVLILILITSGGIYGYLSGAYQTTATQSELLDKGLKVIKMRQVRFEEQKNDLTLEKEQLNKSISDLRSSLSNPAQVQYIDKNSGQLITTTSSSARRTLERELDKTLDDRKETNIKLEEIQDSIIKLDRDILNLEISNEDQRELGPLKYLSEVTGYPMNQVVNWFLLLIIFVFDPLAIAMVIAANFAFSKVGGDKNTKEPKEPKIGGDVEEEFVDTKSTKDIGLEIKDDSVVEKLSGIIDSTKVDEVNVLAQYSNIEHKPIKPKEEDLKKLEQVLGLNKEIEGDIYGETDETSVKDSNDEISVEKKDIDKKILTYTKVVGDNNKEQE